MDFSSATIIDFSFFFFFFTPSLSVFCGERCQKNDA
jgi:hypothetical protein